MVAWLVGEWEGDGRGGYPSVSDFTYHEHTSFEQPDSDEPVLFYAQRTWQRTPTERPSHVESGYLRVLADGRLDLSIAQPVGRSEVAVGSVDGERIELRSVVVACAEHANPVTEVRRVLERRGDNDLWCHLDMAATGHDLGFHCEATLHRS
jgi:hypothetical protein